MSDDDAPAYRTSVPPTPRGISHSPELVWKVVDSTPVTKYQCGYCDDHVSSDRGLKTAYGDAGVYICPSCDCPTFISHQRSTQMPNPKYGKPIPFLPDDVAAAFEESRNCMGVEAYTAAVLITRKILMHVAVDQGAPKNKGFEEYVDYFVDNGHITQSMKGWVEKIRLGGNAATHKLPAISQENAETLMTFTDMLLRLIYEFPTKASGYKK